MNLKLQDFLSLERLCRNVMFEALAERNQLNVNAEILHFVQNDEYSTSIATQSPTGEDRGEGANYQRATYESLYSRT